MAYPAATPADIAFFTRHGYLVVDDAIDPADLDVLIERCDIILEKRHKMAYDWAWGDGVARDEREFRIVQSSPSLFWNDLADAPYRRWAIEFGSALLGAPVEFWYDQFLAKPAGHSAPTPWHQDEAYWGRALADRAITCWMPFHDVGSDDGCMHFIDGGHRDGVLAHRRAPEIQSDLLVCSPDESRAVTCPLRLGGVTFHHGKTPHMTRANGGGSAWRRILTQHLRHVGAPGEGDHYPWKVYVDQRTGETRTPDTR